MKKSLLALAVLAAFAGAAQAQSSVTVYGRMDIGVQKVTDSSATIGRGDNNVIGFKGTEDLGGGLSALFQAEMRFEPDTGTTESRNRRPLFQGQTRVGLKGDFGTIRLGRGLTAMQEPIGGFDPFATQTVAELNSIQMGNYSSSPLQVGSAGNRFDNALFYNTPSFAGFQVNATIATKEAVGTYDAAGIPTTTAGLNKHPVSLSATYNNGPIAAMVGYERNQQEDKFWNLSGAYKVGMANLMATYSNNENLANFETKAWTIGADIEVGSGNVKVGFGKISPDAGADIKKLGIGYWHNLSKRTYLYTDVARTDNGAKVNAFDVGIHHSF
jgi:predicted porin